MSFIPKRSKETLDIIEALDRLHSFTALHPLSEEEKNKVISSITEDEVKTVLASIELYFTQIKADHKAGSLSSKVAVTLDRIMHELTSLSNIFDPKASSFPESIRNYPEYHSLVVFFERHFLPFMPSENSIPKKKCGESRDSVVDFETIKNDFDYELLFLRNENGKRFYDKNLLHSLRLSCELHETDETPSAPDPLISVRYWHNKIVQVLCRNISVKLSSHSTQFYRGYSSYKDMGLAKNCNKMLCALMLAGNERNCMKYNPVKSSYQYFHDFQQFLREILNSMEYQRIQHSAQEQKPFFATIRNLICSTTAALFSEKHSFSEISADIDDLIHLSDDIAHDYQTLTALLQEHPNGPLFKILDLLQDDRLDGFDTIMQDNLPSKICDALIDGQHVDVLRLPSPTKQTSIHRADITPEFYSFLSSLGARHHTLFCLQDRTKWQESVRARALESLNNDTITVCSLSHGTEFDEQKGEYAHINEANVFLEIFFEQLTSSETGYFFPQHIFDELFGSWTKNALAQCHKNFFSSKPNLSSDERRIFIHIFHMMLVKKILQLTHASSMSFTCKDSVDAAGAHTALFARFFVENPLKVIQTLVLFIPLLIRERSMHKKDFLRLSACLSLLDKGRHRVL